MIEDKLREILLDLTLGTYSATGNDNEIGPINWEESPVINNYVAQIKQVFAEEPIRTTDGKPLITGAEWFSRFEREFNGQIIKTETTVLEAAKKASRL